MEKIYLLNNEVSLTSKFAFIHSYHIFPFYGKCITLKEVLPFEEETKVLEEIEVTDQEEVNSDQPQTKLDL